MADSKSTWRSGGRCQAALLLLAGLILLPAPATADSLTSADAEALYARILTDPGNRELNLRYSTLMAKQGNYEAAIPPLERLLVREPDNAWLQLQLGTLYQALDSKAMARTYLNSALQNPKASPEITARASNLLKDM